MKKRLQNRAKSSNRVDDNEESIQKRLKFHRQVQDEILKAFQPKIRRVSNSDKE